MGLIRVWQRDTCGPWREEGTWALEKGSHDTKCVQGFPGATEGFFCGRMRTALSGFSGSCTSRAVFI